MTVAQRREEIRISVGTLNDETLYGMVRAWDGTAGRSLEI
jgi:hypothetical protein